MTVILLGLLVATVSAVGLLVAAIKGALVRNSDLHRTRLTAWAALLGAAAFGVYAWGLIHIGIAVVVAEDGGTMSAPLAPCMDPSRSAAETARVAGYHVRLLPLDFECEVADGGSYSGPVVPYYVMPSSASLAAGAVAIVVMTATNTRLRRGRTAQVEVSRPGTESESLR